MIGFPETVLGGTGVFKSVLGSSSSTQSQADSEGVSFLKAGGEMDLKTRAQSAVMRLLLRSVTMKELS